LKRRIVPSATRQAGFDFLEVVHAGDAQSDTYQSPSLRSNALEIDRWPHDKCRVDHERSNLKTWGS